MEWDVVLLSRLQFALTIMFHYLFPPLTIGLGGLIVIYETYYLTTKNTLWKSANIFWIKVFAVTFAVGVATGIVMEFEFGTNWANYSRFVGDVFGSALAAEGIFAFFLESGFLAVLVFGRDRVGKKFYYFSTWMVFLGSVFSSIWIVIANSWMQTPGGSHITQMMVEGQPWFIDGEPVMRAEMTSFWGVVFNISSVNRLTHVWSGCIIMGGFFVLSICAWYIMRNKHLEVATKCFKVALVYSFVGVIAAVVTGDSNARMVAFHQPAKLAAMEGIYHTSEGPTGIHLFGVPDSKTETVKMSVVLPDALSILVYRDLPPTKPVPGLDQIAPEDRPPVFIPFVAFHTMVGIGFGLLGLMLLAFWFWWRGSLFKKKWMMFLFVISVLGAVAANELGWVTAEVGRQPWIVVPPVVVDEQGEFVRNADGYIQYQKVEYPTESGQPGKVMPMGMRTSDGHSKIVTAGQVVFSIIMFGAIYILLFFVWVFVLNSKIQKGPVLTGESTSAPEGFLRTAGEHAHGHKASLAEEHDNAGESDPSKSPPSDPPPPHTHDNGDLDDPPPPPSPNT
ncbi:cytochrome ubiquinol oxidase subunit I [Poriferisphaera sp. WC338]|uniref:cytochrome ubiquinol oxidase subunit I n=1 Tax=Poriferisphaera sp. WC338 TaxID=3425129 RepID=UPI003D81B898